MQSYRTTLQAILCSIGSYPDLTDNRRLAYEASALLVAESSSVNEFNVWRTEQFAGFSLRLLLIHTKLLQHRR